MSVTDRRYDVTYTTLPSRYRFRLKMSSSGLSSRFALLGVESRSSSSSAPDFTCMGYKHTDGTAYETGHRHGAWGEGEG